MTHRTVTAVAAALLVAGALAGEIIFMGAMR
jgi:hypothetical protein